MSRGQQTVYFYNGVFVTHTNNVCKKQGPDSALTHWPLGNVAIFLNV